MSSTTRTFSVCSTRKLPKYSVLLAVQWDLGLSASLNLFDPCFSAFNLVLAVEQFPDLFTSLLSVGSRFVHAALCVWSVCPWGHSICFSLWIDLFVSAAFTTCRILRKSQQLAHKGPAAIPGLHVPALSTEQHILAGLWMGAEGLQASGIGTAPPGVALQPGVWAQQYLLSSQGQWVDKNSRQRGAGDTEMGPVYVGSHMTPGHLESLKGLWPLNGRCTCCW